MTLEQSKSYAKRYIEKNFDKLTVLDLKIFISKIFNDFENKLYEKAMKDKIIKSVERIYKPLDEIKILTKLPVNSLEREDVIILQNKCSEAREEFDEFVCMLTDEINLFNLCEIMRKLKKTKGKEMREQFKEECNEVYKTKDCRDLIDDIFDEFKSRVCKECKYYEGGNISGFCLNMQNTFMNKDSNIDVEADFGCNRFEKKEKD